MNRERLSHIRFWLWILSLIAVLILWGSAVFFGFIGDTSFIGHVSMLALVLSVGSAVEASLPSVGDHEGEE